MKLIRLLLDDTVAHWTPAHWSLLGRNSWSINNKKKSNCSLLGNLAARLMPYIWSNSEGKYKDYIKCSFVINMRVQSRSAG